MGWSDYADYLIGQRLGPQTRARYLRWVREADEWLGEQGTTLELATATQVAGFADAKITNSHACRGQAAAALRHYWDMTAPEMVCRAIEEAQARDVVKVATGWWPEGGVVLVGMYLALRRFETAKMEWDRFTEDLSWYTVTGKYDKTCTIPVHPHLRRELEGRNTNEARWVFPGRYPGRHVAVATVWDWTIKVGLAAGVPRLKPHELRHTALATANDRTGNLRAVQSFARHSKPSTTSGYTRTTAARLREVSESLDYLD